MDYDIKLLAMTIGDRRVCRGWDTKTLADKANVEQKTILALEKDNILPSDEDIKKLFTTLEFDINKYKKV